MYHSLRSFIMYLSAACLLLVASCTTDDVANLKESASHWALVDDSCNDGYDAAGEPCEESPPEPSSCVDDNDNACQVIGDCNDGYDAAGEPCTPGE